MRSHFLCLLAVLAALLLASSSVARVGAKPSFTMPDGEGDEAEEEDVAVEVAEDPVEVDGQTEFKSPVIEPPLNEAEEEEEEETPKRRSSKGTFSLLFSKGSWFKSFFRPKPAVANPTEGIDDEDGETEIEPISTMVDGVDVGSDDTADDESQRGRRHLPPHWKVLTAKYTAAPNKGRQPLAMPPNKGSAVGSSPPPNRRYESPASKPPVAVDGLAAAPYASWRPARKTYAPKKQWYRHYQSPSYYSRRQWYAPRKYADSKKSSADSTAFPNRVGVPNRGNYPNSAWQYSPYNYLSKEPPRKQSSTGKGDGY